MDRELIRRWNERVKENDVVFHLGDFCFRKSRIMEKDGEIIEKILKGYNYYSSKLNGNIILIRGNHDSKNDVKSILTEAVINYGGWDWYLKHEPHNTFKYNLCGHVHNLWKVRRQGPYITVNLSVDVWNFYPVNISEIINAIQEDDKRWVF